jgi:hypothetical protein
VNETQYENSTYLGDGAYAEMTEIGLQIYTSDGIQVTNRVFLGSSEWKALLAFVASGRYANPKR